MTDIIIDEAEISPDAPEPTPTPAVPVEESLTPESDLISEADTAPEEETLLPVEDELPSEPEAEPQATGEPLPEGEESPAEPEEATAETEEVPAQPKEAAAEPEAAPAQTVDMAPVLEALSALQTQVTELSASLGTLQAQATKLSEDFNAKLRYDASKKEIIDKQFQELDAYHREAHEKLSKAIVMDLISEIDGAERSAEHYESLAPTQENYAKLKKLIMSHADDLRDVLENNEIESYRTAPGDPFDHKRHSVLKTIPTEDSTLAKTIQASLRSGYVKAEKVIRPEKVAVYVLNAQQ